MIDLDEAERIGNAATPGPWNWAPDTMASTVRYSLHMHPKADADFVAYVLNNWPAIIDELRRLRAEVVRTNVTTVGYDFTGKSLTSIGDK